MDTVIAVDLGVSFFLFIKQVFKLSRFIGREVIDYEIVQRKLKKLVGRNFSVFRPAELSSHCGEALFF